MRAIYTIMAASVFCVLAGCSSDPSSSADLTQLSSKSIAFEAAPFTGAVRSAAGQLAYCSTEGAACQ